MHPWITAASLSLLLFAHRGTKPSKHSKDPDYAAEGAAEYQDGNYAKAIVSLRKAAQKTPTNAYVWFNLGRATVANGPILGADECDDDKSWKYSAMQSFNKALALDRTEILAKLKQLEPKLAPFRETAEYRKWMKSLEPAPKGDDEVNQFFATESSWFVPTGDVTFMDLEPGGTVQRYGPTDDDHGDAEGRWRVRKAVLEVTWNEGTARRYLLQHGPYSWQLKGPEGVWEPGPILRDCSSKKK
jgi:tetratricopeptide (TPR) repeat protein